jgi:hypothetical protein
VSSCSVVVGLVMRLFSIKCSKGIAVSLLVGGEQEAGLEEVGDEGWDGYVRYEVLFGIKPRAY